MTRRRGVRIRQTGQRFDATELFGLPVDSQFEDGQAGGGGGWEPMLGQRMPVGRGQVIDRGRK